jgi:hypothetical protein
LKIPGKNAGSGSISRLGPRFIDRLPRITRPNPSSAQNSNREGDRLETGVNQRKQTARVDSNRETGACFPGLLGRKGERNSNRESQPSETAVTNPISSNRENERTRWSSRAGTPTSGVAGAASGRPYEENPTAKVKNAGWQPALRGTKRISATSRNSDRTKLSRSDNEKNA